MKIIKSKAFENCTCLTSVVLQEGLKIIGKECFRSTSIKEVTIPKSVIRISYDSFPKDTLIFHPADYMLEGVLTQNIVKEKLC